MTFKDLVRSDFFTTKEPWENMYMKTKDNMAIDFVLAYEQEMSPDMEVRRCEWFFWCAGMAARINRFLHRRFG